MQPIEVTIQPPIALQKADERFILFLKKASFPIDEAQIISWYQQHVQRANGGYFTEEVDGVRRKAWREYEPTEVRRLAIDWFDRSLGRTIRKAIIPNEATKLLTPIREIA